MPVARWLKLDKSDAGQHEPAPLELEITHGSAHQAMYEYKVTPESGLDGKTLAEIGFPPGVLVTMLRRNNKFVPPHGNTEIRNGDGMLIMGEREQLREIVKKYFPGQEKENHDPIDERFLSFRLNRG